MFQERKRFSLVIQNNREKYTLVNYEHHSFADDFSNINNLTLEQIDIRFLKPLITVATVDPTPLQKYQPVSILERNQKTGFLKLPNKFYIDAKLIKENIFPYSFEDYVEFAKLKFMFPPCIAGIILRCVERKIHPKNDERLILGKFLFSLYFSEDQVIDFFAKMYACEEKFKDITFENFYKTGDRDVIRGIRQQHSKNGSPSCSDIIEKKLCPFATDKLNYKRQKNETNESRKYNLVESDNKITDIEDLLKGKQCYIAMLHIFFYVYVADIMFLLCNDAIFI